MRSVPTPRHDGLAAVYVVYMIAVAAVVGVLILDQPRLAHWFLLPILGLALVIGVDVIRWFVGRVAPFDPRGILSLLALHAFVVAPILVAYWNVPFDIAASPPDWRPWLGLIAAFTLIGWSGGRWIAAAIARSRRSAAVRWTISPARVRTFLWPAIILSALAQIYVWYRVGGIASQMEAFRGAERGVPAGLYKFRVVASTLPVLLMIAMTVRRDRLERRDRGLTALIVVFVLYLLIDGVRGSRSSVVWTMFWAAGVVHFFWRPIRARHLLLALIPMVAFMYVYGFYKAYGADVLERYYESGSLGALSQKSGRTLERIAIADTSRADVQAYLLYRTSQPHLKWEPAHGRTYVDAIRRLVPLGARGVVPYKATAAAGLLYGPQSARYYKVSKVYGLGGEAILNFGMWGIVPAYLVLGIILGLIARWLDGLPPRDGRLLLAPLATVVCVALVIGDFDNVLALLLNKVLLPSVIVALLCERRRT